MIAMRRRRRFWNSAWLASSLAVLAVQSPNVCAQRDLADTTGPSAPTEVRRESARAQAVRFVPPQVAERGDQQFKEILEAKRQSYRTLLISELYFCRSACGLTEAQGQTIAKRAGAAVEKAATEAARLNLKPAKRGGIWLSTDPKPPNAVKLIREILQKLMTECATSVQQARYQAENEKRAVHRRETAIHAVVARLDRMLMLSSSQREQLLRLFASNWNEEWGVMGGVLGDDDGPLPAIPDKLIVPFLSAAQRKLWKQHDKQAIDATEAYIAVVDEIMEGLPSDFTATLEGAVGPREKPPSGEEKNVDVKGRER
jgi:hypothetical protein